MTPSSKPRYAVVGNPVGHSRSPWIHGEFARQCNIDLEYTTLLAPLDAFAPTIREFFESGGRGLNVTVPFKEQAYELAHADLSPRARLAGAVNTLWTRDGRLHGCNTDGVGLLADLQRLGYDPAGRRILLVGAGGAARGVVLPLLEAGCTRLHIVNRSPEKAAALHESMARQLPEHAERLSSGGLPDATGSWDIVINATSGSLSGQAPALPPGIFARGALAYDMVYSSRPTAFMEQAAAQGAARCSDGLGMLVEQAAASFAIWHGVMPETEEVLAGLRAELRAA
jgi:shikimate dehydrogenase